VWVISRKRELGLSSGMGREACRYDFPVLLNRNAISNSPGLEEVGYDSSICSETLIRGSVRGVTGQRELTSCCNPAVPGDNNIAILVLTIFSFASQVEVADTQCIRQSKAWT